MSVLISEFYSSKMSDLLMKIEYLCDYPLLYFYHLKTRHDVKDILSTIS